MHAQKYDFGVAKSHAIEDMLNSKSIFVWGKIQHILQFILCK